MNKSGHGSHPHGTHSLLEGDGFQSNNRSQIVIQIPLHPGITGMKKRCRVLLGKWLVQGGFSEEGNFELKPIG